MTGLRLCCMLVAVGFLTGCGQGSSTPKDAFGSFKGVMADKNFEDAWDMLSKATQDSFNANAKTFAARNLADTETGPNKLNAETVAKMMGITVKKMKTMDGKALFVGLSTWASAEGKDVWQQISRAQFERQEEEGVGRVLVYVKLDDKVQEKAPVRMVLEDGQWKVDLPPDKLATE